MGDAALSIGYDQSAGAAAPPSPNYHGSISNAVLNGSTSFLPAGPPPPAGSYLEHYILFFDYRTFFESADIDAMSQEGWLECLASFGYAELDKATFLKELALRTPSEIMMSLCPFTTAQEWGPALNKRDVRLTKEFGEFCSTNVLPLDGIRAFIMSSHMGAKITVALLSPFNEAHTEMLLKASNLRPLVDFVIPYHALDVAALEALEVIDVPPPRFPNTVSSTRWAHRAPDEKLALPTRYLAFVSSAEVAKYMGGFGISSIGITRNNEDHEDDDDDCGASGRRPSRRNWPLLPGCDSAETILSAPGALCRQVLSDYRGLTFEYLRNAAWWSAPAYQ